MIFRQILNSYLFQIYTIFQTGLLETKEGDYLCGIADRQDIWRSLYQQPQINTDEDVCLLNSQRNWGLKCSNSSDLHLVGITIGTAPFTLEALPPYPARVVLLEHRGSVGYRRRARLQLQTERLQGLVAPRSRGFFRGILQPGRTCGKVPATTESLAFLIRASDARSQSCSEPQH